MPIGENNRHEAIIQDYHVSTINLEYVSKEYDIKEMRINVEINTIHMKKYNHIKGESK